MAGTTWTSSTLRFAALVVDRPWMVLVATLVAAILAAAGARYLAVDSSYQVWFGPKNPELAAYEAIQNSYTRNDSILFVVTPRGDDVFTNGTLSAVKALTEGAWKIPYSRRVDSVTNFQHTRASGDELVVGDLV